MRNFLSLSDAGPSALGAMLDEAARRKRARAGWPKGRSDEDAPLAGRVLAMIFERNSTRTRVSFDMAMRQLGGAAIALEAGAMQLGRGETVGDTARVMSRYVDAIMLRTEDHDKLDQLARHAEVPVLNGLTDRSHPCQTMADLLTVRERLGRLAGTKWAWLGDGNNVLHSLIEAAGPMELAVDVACPERFEPDEQVVVAARERGAEIGIVRDPRAAVKDADVVATDCWVSMGQEGGGEAKVAALEPYRVDERIMRRARPEAIFLHCLPAHRGEEVVDAVIDGAQSAVWDEAENRLHAQKAILLWCFGLIG